MSTIKVLGPGCKNCERLTHLTEQALDELGRSEHVEKITDYGEIASYGVMSTPAIVVDDQLLMAGRIPALSSLKDALAERLAEVNRMAVAERPRSAPAGPIVPGDTAVLQKLSTLDRYLPLWIGLAMAAGLGLGRLIPSLNDGLDKLQVGTVSLPIALGLLLMMYPVLAKVRYEELGRMRHDGVSDRRFFGVSLFLSWVIGPLLMFTLAWLLLPNQPAYRTGVIIVGLARCIAMVLIWNDIAKGDRDRTAILVVFNALFQVAAYSLLGYFYLTVLPGWLGLDTQGFEVGIWEVARTVLIFLGIPLAAGFLTRRIGLKRKGRTWYDQKFIPRIGPITLYGLLFTIVVLFAIQGDKITSQPLDVARIALPLLVYFAVMWVAGFTIGKLIGLPYAQTASMGFTVASNDFELAIAVAVGVFGATSGQALAGVVGPLIEVPVLVALVYVALWARRFWPTGDSQAWPTRSAEA